MKDRHEGMKDRPGYCSFCPLLLALLQYLPRFVVVLPDGWANQLLLASWEDEWTTPSISCG